MIDRNIKNIIFDLGGVIIDLDVSKTHQAFASLSGISVQEIASDFSNQPFFIEYEKGLISDQEFRSQIRTSLKTESTDEQIDRAWNAMLLSIAKEKFSLLSQLKNKYQIFLLSNTNNIHLVGVNEVVFKIENKPNLDDYFHKTYYSHLMHLRKPDKEIFEQVLQENNLLPQQTLFLDDNFNNIKGGQSVGLQTIQITSSNLILSLFS